MLGDDNTGRQLRKRVGKQVWFEGANTHGERQIATEFGVMRAVRRWATSVDDTSPGRCSNW